jgi:N-acetylmuramoyl-L-alanine amidase
MTPTAIVLHTTAFRGSADIKEIERWHIARGFKKVGYHYYIRRDGKIETGRHETEMGAHCKAGGMNRSSLGVCFEGHGDFEPWTPEQVEAWEALYLSIRLRYKIEPHRVFGHNEFEPNKTCPGKLINMDSVRLDISKIGAK